MSSYPALHSTEQLRQQFEALSQKASTMAISLARRRADVALMRAEAATVAVSLESAKEELDGLLRKETAIRTNAPMSPDAQEARADFFPDQGLVRSLAGQLEVTQSSVEAALKRKLCIQTEIDLLEKQIGNTTTLECPQEGQPMAAPKEQPPVRRTASAPRDAQSHIAHLSGTKMLPRSASEAPRAACNLTEEGVLRRLNEGVESNSSFRSDHAKIWRDITMPNLVLIRRRAGAITEEDVSLGVITERIFEGITCFTPTSAVETGKKSSAADLRVERSGEIRQTEAHIVEIVANHFAALSVTSRDDSSTVRFIAPHVALSRVMDLISEDNEDIVRRGRPTLSVEKDEDEISTVDESVAPVLPLQSPRRDRLHDTNFSVVLSDPSHVLNVEYFKQIMVQGVPVRFHESGLELIYSTNVHGISLHTLFSRVRKSSPTLIAIRDTKDRVFGCYAANPWKSSAARYYGTGESFVFGTSGPNDMKVFKWSRENSFFQFSSSTFLAIGGGAGSHFALWVDEDLHMGTTSACSTFASPPLTSVDDEDAPNCMEFKIVSLELWSFNAHIRH